MSDLPYFLRDVSTPEILLEEVAHKYGMLALRPDAASLEVLKELQSRIDPADACEEEGGVVNDLHLTLLCGLTSAPDPALVDSISTEIDQIGMRIAEICEFGEFSIVACLRPAPALLRMRHAAEALPHAPSKWPEYRPHITLAYLREDTVGRYLTINRRLPVPEIALRFDELYFSNPSH